MTTIRDVAKLAGVGVGTVSRALSQSGPVSKEALIAVENAVRKLNYRPSPTARSLSTGRTGLIGVLVPQFDGAYFGVAIATAERVIRASGHHMVIMSTQSAPGLPWSEALGLESLAHRRVDGILHLSTRHSTKELIMAATEGPELAIVNRKLDTLRDICFSVDHYAAGRSVASFLLARGHSKFATITGPLDVEDALERHSGFMDGLKASGVCVDEDLIVQGSFYLESGRPAAERLVAAKKDFSALFCGNDLMAISAQAYLRQAGLHPDVVGYDNTSLLDMAGLKISSVMIPIAEIVRNGVLSLLNRCYGESHELIHDFDTQIVAR